jgi:CheY-like chemotaxis protein
MESILMTEAPFQIVLVEDAEPDVLLVREALERTGMQFELQVLDDGEKGMAFVADLDRTPGCPDLILLDLNLPKRNGGEVLERLRQNEKCSNVPVVVLTSSDSPKDKAQVMQFGATEFFRKPSSLDAFMRLGPLVRRLLESRARATA